MGWLSRRIRDDAEAGHRRRVSGGGCAGGGVILSRIGCGSVPGEEAGWAIGTG
jgi:hypothetical protein